MSRFQDSVIDDDEEYCPLCIEEFDLSDKNFRPCPCNYQICQFCYNSLKNTYEKSTCPNCRRPYDDSKIQYKIPTAEELKLDQLNKSKKLAAARRKETEKKEVETSNRRNLAGVRVKQQNLVYVIGLEPSKKDESSLMDLLRGKDYFGQYGPIDKIVVSKPKPGAVNQGIGVYVTFKNKEDAATCINCVDGSSNGDKILRAQYGTTKYCSTYLRGETCQNKNCSFLHESGEDGQSTSLQNEPIDKPRPIPPRAVATPQPVLAAQAMARQTSSEKSLSRQTSIDASALPTSAAWANAPVAKARRLSQAHSSPSPQITHASLASQKPEPVIDTAVEPDPKPEQSTPPSPEEQSASESVTAASPSSPSQAPLDSLASLLRDFKSKATVSCAFVFDDSCLSEETREAVASMPPLFDPYGGAKERVRKDKEAHVRATADAEDKARLEEQAKNAAEEALQDNAVAAGSLALGGEPEDHPTVTASRGAIGGPQQTSSLPSDQFVNLGLNGRSLTPQQRQQLAVLTGNAQQQARIPPVSSQNTAFELSDFDRRGPQYSQAQYDQMSNHARHGSRYFNNEAKSASSRFSAHPQQQPQQQQQPFFTSGVQGPPPGLPTAGTPPVSGGGMFAHGQGFTSSGFGTTKDANTDALRNRSGTNATHDVKRGGAEHLADPSILSARLHQGQQVTTSASQGLFGGNQESVDKDKDFPPLPRHADPQSTLHSRVSSLQSFGRSGTPKVPPGFERTSTPKVPPGFEGITSSKTSGDLTEVEQDSPSKDKAAPVLQPALPIEPALPTAHRAPAHELDTAGRGEQSSAHHEGVLVPDHSSESLDQPKNQTDASLTKPIASDKASDPAPNTSAESARSRELHTSGEDKDIFTVPQHEPEVKPPVVAEESFATPSESRRKKKNKTKNESANASRTSTPPPTNREDTKSPPLIPFKDSAGLNTPSVTASRPGSRPATPATGTSDLKQPRTLRLTTEMIQKAQKADTSAVPPSAATERSIGFAPFGSLRLESRRPSISTSRPSTPAASERLMSQDVSRAGSPPASLVGTAPARGKTKNQLKKERREKAKKVTEVSDTASTPAAPTPPPTEEVAPIIARQKKQKKSKSSSSMPSRQPSISDIPKKIVEEDYHDHQGADSPIKASDDQDSRHVTSQVQPESSPTPLSPVLAGRDDQQPYLLRDLYTDLGRMQAATSDQSQVSTSQHIQKLLGQHTSSMQKLLSEMISAGDVSKDHPLFTPPSFNSQHFKLPTDTKRGQEYLDAHGYTGAPDEFGQVYLPLSERQALYRGHAVSVADPVSEDGSDRRDKKQDLLRRCLVTPSGWVLRHLTSDESEKVLDLEARHGMYIDSHGDVGMMDNLDSPLESDDFINLTGGVDELGKYGHRHGIVWVDDRNRDVQRQSRLAGGLEDDYGLGEYPGDDLDDGLMFEGDDDADLDDDETDDDLEILDPQDARLQYANDHSFNATNDGLADIGLPPNTLPPLQGHYQRQDRTQRQGRSLVNLKAMDLEALQKKVAQQARELDGIRKEAEKAEKAMNKKSRDGGRWRDSVFKLVQPT